MARVNKDGPVHPYKPELGPCWMWIGSVSAGRPIMKWQGKSTVPARVSLMLSTGRNAKDLCALHTCDNAMCVSPEHLYWGTKADNGKDMSQRNRVRWDNGFIGRKGEDNIGARFTNAQIIEMRTLHWEQGESLTSLAKKFGLKTGHVSRICNGLRWAHLKEGLPNPQEQATPATTQTKLLFCIAVISNLRTALLRCVS